MTSLYEVCDTLWITVHGPRLQHVLTRCLMYFGAPLAQYVFKTHVGDIFGIVWGVFATFVILWGTKHSNGRK